MSNNGSRSIRFDKRIDRPRSSIALSVLGKKASVSRIEESTEFANRSTIRCASFRKTHAPRDISTKRIRGERDRPFLSGGEEVPRREETFLARRPKTLPTLSIITDDRRNFGIASGTNEFQGNAFRRNSPNQCKTGTGFCSPPANRLQTFSGTRYLSPQPLVLPTGPETNFCLRN